MSQHHRPQYGIRHGRIALLVVGRVHQNLVEDLEQTRHVANGALNHAAAFPHPHLLLVEFDRLQHMHTQSENIQNEWGAESYGVDNNEEHARRRTCEPPLTPMYVSGRIRMCSRCDVLI